MNTLYDASLPVTLGGLVTHALLIQNFFANQYQIVLIAILGTVIIISCAYVFYLLFERPFIVLRSKAFAEGGGAVYLASS
jgi:hypothetical protein